MVGVPRSKGSFTSSANSDSTADVLQDAESAFKGASSVTRRGQHFRDEGPKLKQRLQESPTAEKKGVEDVDELPAPFSFNAIAPLPAPGSVAGSDLTDDGLNQDQNDSPSFWLVPAQQQQVRHGLDFQSFGYDPGLYGLETHFAFYYEKRRKAQPVDITLHAHISSPALQQQQLLHGFTQAVAPPTRDYIPSVLKTQWAWLHRLPDLMGTDALLDSAIRAVTLVQLGRQQHSRRLINESRPYYGKALRLLNSILTRDNEAGLSNKTLSATALLSFYEMFASDSTLAWVQHAGGVAALMCQRGPKMHRYGFGREILRAYRFTLVTEAFQSGRPSFLVKPEWQHVLAQISKDIREEQRFSGIEIALYDIIESCFTITAEATQVTSEVKTWIQTAKQNTVADITGALNKFERMKIVRSNYEQCQESFRQILSDMNSRPIVYLIDDPLFPQQYDYKNMFTSLFYAGYRTTATILNRHILLLGRELIKAGKISPQVLSFYAEDSRKLAIQVCKSIDFMMRSSFLGPFFAVFALRLASQVFVPGEREWDWVIGKLFGIADRYFMMAKHLPWYEAAHGNMEELKLAAYRGGFRFPDSHKADR